MVTAAMDPLFDTGSLREMQALNEASLPSRAVLSLLERQTYDGGRTVEAWIPALTDVPCRLSPGTPPAAPEAVAGQLAAESRWTITFPAGTPAPEGCRVDVSGTDVNGTAWTRTLYVIDAHGPATYEVLRKVTATDAPPRSA